MAGMAWWLACFSSPQKDDKLLILFADLSIKNSNESNPLD
jgi:hypothetical protein